MFKNHFRSAIRNLLKHKGFSTLNIAGLAIGLAASLLILQYVSFETSYDTFHDDHEQIFRVQLDQYQEGELLFASSENYPGVGPAIVKEFPEALEFARLYNLGAKNNMVVSWDDAPGKPVDFKQKRLLYADASFLPMFSYKVLQGNPETALAEPYSMVITESYARKYFGEEEALGKMLHMKDDDFNDELCKVTAVVEDPRPNTHLKFDVLISYPTLYARGDWAPDRYNTSWRRKDMYTYIKVEPGTDIQALEAKFPSIVETYNPGLQEDNRRDVLSLQALTDIHLYSDLSDEAEINGNGESVFFLTIIAFFILLIAYINYINLSTARSLERANEVGVRKVMGARRNQLIRQFLLESSLLNIAGIVIALLLVELTLPFFNQLTGIDFTHFSLWSEGWFYAVVIGLFFAGSFLSGLYPAFVLSSFKPIDVLSSKYGSGRKGGLFRKALVTFQFAISVALIVGTMIVYEQMDYMMEQDLGFNMDQTLVVERPGVRAQEFEDRKQQIEGFTERLAQHASVNKVTRSSTLLGKKMRFKAVVRRYEETQGEGFPLTASGIDFDFIEAMEMEVVAGRGFSMDFSTDADTACLLTVSATKALGFENPEDALNKTLAIDQFRWNPIVVGVLKDYHQESLKLAAQPTVFYPTLYGAEYYLLKVNTQNLPNTLAHVEQVWAESFPGNPFQYFFLDDYFNRQYERDRRFGKIFALFALFAILVGCLGLFGLSAFMTQRRVKEIGIRKVLGASLSNILVLLTKDFMRLIILANLIAWPVIGWLMHRWLEGFAYRVELNWWVFLLAGLAVLLMALVTISTQAFKAAGANPAESLRSE